MESSCHVWVYVEVQVWRKQVCEVSWPLYRSPSPLLTVTRSQVERSGAGRGLSLSLVTGATRFCGSLSSSSGSHASRKCERMAVVISVWLRGWRGCGGGTNTPDLVTQHRTHVFVHVTGLLHRYVCTHVGNMWLGDGWDRKHCHMLVVYS